MGEPRILVCQPIYRGPEMASIYSARDLASEHEGRTGWKPMESPMLCGNFNALWAYALNTRAEFGWTHLAYLHQDVAAPRGWTDRMVREMERTGVQWLSQILRIKDGSGLTSTAVLNKGTLCTRRLARKEIVSYLPVTFTSADLKALGHKNHLLLHGSGMFLVDLSAPWVGKVWWESPSRLLQDAAGQYYSAVFDEGWNISLQVYSHGGTIACTRLIEAVHLGGGQWDMQETADEWETDVGDTDQSWILGRGQG